MHIIIGLGNPGSLYAGTRHNIGFAVLDAVAEQRNIAFKPGKGDYWIGRGSGGSEDLILIKPTTMMNNSGIAVRDVVERFESEQTELIIVYDEIHLPIGTLRFRQRGSDGGHNGMGSIIYHLQSEEIPRLRCGIWNPLQDDDSMNQADFVLSPFNPGEHDAVREMILRARDALTQWIEEGINAVMNRWNPRMEE